MTVVTLRYTIASAFSHTITRRFRDDVCGGGKSVLILPIAFRGVINVLILTAAPPYPNERLSAMREETCTSDGFQHAHATAVKTRFRPRKWHPCRCRHMQCSPAVTSACMQDEQPR